MPPCLSLFTDGQSDFAEALSLLARRGDTDLDRVEAVVREILHDVRSGGDAAVLRYVERFEQRKPSPL